MRELQKIIMQNCQVEGSASRKGFADHVLEFFYGEYIEPLSQINPKSAICITFYKLVEKGRLMGGSLIGVRLPQRENSFFQA